MNNIFYSGTRWLVTLISTRRSRFESLNKFILFHSIEQIMILEERIADGPDIVGLLPLYQQIMRRVICILKFPVLQGSASSNWRIYLVPQFQWPFIWNRHNCNLVELGCQHYSTQDSISKVNGARMYCYKPDLVSHHIYEPILVLYDQIDQLLTSCCSGMTRI